MVESYQIGGRLTMGLFGTLGKIEFETLTSPQSFESTKSYSYGKLDVIEGRPRLQWISADLEEITLTLRWHRLFCNPYQQFRALEKAADDHQALALVFGNGIHRGYFVIKEISETITHTADDGTVIDMSVDVTLTEYVQGSAVSELASPDPPPGLRSTAPKQSGASAVSAGRPPRPSWKTININSAVPGQPRATITEGIPPPPYSDIRIADAGRLPPQFMPPAPRSSHV